MLVEHDRRTRSSIGVDGYPKTCPKLDDPGKKPGNLAEPLARGVDDYSHRIREDELADTSRDGLRQRNEADRQIGLLCTHGLCRNQKRDAQQCPAGCAYMQVGSDHAAKYAPFGASRKGSTAG